MLLEGEPCDASAPPQRAARTLSVARGAGACHSGALCAARAAVLSWWDGPGGQYVWVFRAVRRDAGRDRGVLEPGLQAKVPCPPPTPHPAAKGYPQP